MMLSYSADVFRAEKDGFGRSRETDFVASLW